jgi:alpha-ketoglutarate-dependent taurine dioxygenase|tara:strand:+ start:483 stop:1373 length:891 start_codon:yes stop_codon:yes gene_type:complete
VIEKKPLSSKFLDNGIILKSKKSITPLKINKSKVISLFKKNGCILFRNFKFTAENYKKFTDIFTKNYATDTNDISRRKKTKYSKFIRHVDAGYKKMSLHSEASFSPSWPEIVWFFCEEPAKKNGETTICDGIKLWESLSETTKEFFLSNPLKYKLKIPALEAKKNGKKKKWMLNKQGAYDAIIDYKTGILNITQVRFAANDDNVLKKLSFSNHVLHKKPYIDKSINKWGTIFDKNIPKKILKEIEEKSEILTYYHKWKKFDLLMIDNKRFMHARNFFNKNDKRKILNTQTLESNFN